MLSMIVSVATVFAVFGTPVPEIRVEQPGGNSLVDGASTVDFARALPNVPTYRLFTIRNIGSANLTGVAITFSGPHAGDFSLTAPVPTTIAPGQSISFYVTCRRNATGLRTATMHIASNDLDENPFDIALTATGMDPQQAILRASNDDTGDEFGYSVSISGDTAVVGAPRESSRFGQNDNSANNAGAVYVFVRNGSSWSQQAFLKASNIDPGDLFGFSVALSGNTLVVGAPYEGSTAAGVNGNQFINTACGAGAAYVFVRNGTTWSQQAYLKASNPEGAPPALCDPGDYFGWSVAISGDTIVVGAMGEDSNATGVNGDGANNNAPNSGAAYVFVRDQTTWTQQAYLKASNTGANDQFGASVALSGNTLVVGASFEADSGAAYVFTRDATTWSQQAYLKASNPDRGDAFGEAVAVWGNTIVVGASGEDSNATGVNGDQNNNSSENAGAAYVFVRNGTMWSQQAYLKGNFSASRFGHAVALLGDTVVIGAWRESLAGAAYVFLRGGVTWTEQAYLRLLAVNTNDEFGWALAISGHTMVVGAPFEEPFNEQPPDAGAAYVFVGLGPPLQEIAVEQPFGNDLVDGSSSVHFGSGLLDTSSEHTFTIRNLGNADLTGLVITIGGPNAADFTVTANPTAPVVPGGSTTFTVTFLPSSAGPKRATLHIASNDADENPFDIELTGAGLSLIDIAQQAYVKQSNTDAGDTFGFSVAVAGSLVVIGAPGEDSSATGVNGNQNDNGAIDSGAAYVFVRNGTTWTQEAYLKASNPGAGDSFGYSVAISFTFISPSFVPVVVVGATGESSADGNPNDNSAPNAGAAYVFTRAAVIPTWSQRAYLKASNIGAEDQFGHSVSVSGNTLVVGAIFEDSNATGVDGNQADNSAVDAGAAYVFVRSGTAWIQQAYLKAADSDPDDRFGRSVAISGNTIVVGAPREDSDSAGVNGNPANNSRRDAGAVYIFVRSGALWTQQAYLKASNPGMDDWFGYNVALSGDTAVVGAVFEDSGTRGVNGNQSANNIPQSGAGYVFVRSGSAWSQQAYLKASNTDTNDQFGSSVAVSGDIIVVGTTFEDSGSTGINGNQGTSSSEDSGAAYVFIRSGTSWAQQAYLKASNTGAGDQFGYAVTVSGDTVVVGAPFEDSNATGINGLQNNNSAVDSGAAYIFSGFCVGPRLIISPDGVGGYFIRAVGGCTHRLQRASAVTGPWSTLGAISSEAGYHDAAPVPGQAFYRTVQP